MKWIILLIALPFLTSCEKEEVRITILRAEVNGVEYDFLAAAAYRYKDFESFQDIENDNAFRYTYHIFNTDTPKLWIFVYDSSFVETQFDFSDLSARFSVQDFSAGVFNQLVSYKAFDGELSISKEKKGVLYGNFNFILINENDASDTLIISNGYFELTLLDGGNRPL